jgi:hypothetical protein
MDREQFVAELEQLTPNEIAERLGSLDAEQLALLQDYLRSKGLDDASASKSKPSPAKDEAVRLSVETSQRAHSMAMLAAILSVGAMLAAIAAAVVGFLALGGARISW